MLSVNHGIVHSQNKGPEEMWEDLTAAITSFICFSRKSGIEDQFIEKSLIEMVCDAFEMAKHTETINKGGYFKGGEYEGLDREQ